jgi:hypothetical protein
MSNFSKILKKVIFIYTNILAIKYFLTQRLLAIKEIYPWSSWIIIPLLFLLVFSKEFISYDSEKVIILCIIYFIFNIEIYFNKKIKKYLIIRSLQVKKEYIDLILLKEKVQKELIVFLHNFFFLENSIINIYHWIKFNVINFLKKFNINRNFFIYHIIKDQLNIILKDQIKINQYLITFWIKNTFNNLRIIFTKKLENLVLNFENLSFYFNKLNRITNEKELLNIIFN